MKKKKKGEANGKKDVVNCPSLSSLLRQKKGDQKETPPKMMAPDERRRRRRRHNAHTHSVLWSAVANIFLSGQCVQCPQKRSIPKASKAKHQKHKPRREERRKAE